MGQQVSGEDILKVLALAGAGFAWTYQWRGRHRTKLRADLEILGLYNKLDPGSERCKNLRARIEHRMDRLYPSPSKRKDIDRSDLATGLLFFVASICLLVYGPKDWYYVVFSSLLGLAGGARIYMGLEHKLGRA
jgi:hypothetical protein